MPVSVAFDQRNTFLLEASGDVTYPQVRNAIAEILAHPNMAAGRKLLVEANRVTAAPTSAELRAILRDMKPLFAAGLGAMAIVTDKAFVYGVARMFSAFAEAFGYRVRAFHRVAEAMGWLVEANPAGPREPESPSRQSL